ncbi:MAG: DUF2854 domain-containing protein [Crinalium sp.]
MLRQISLGKLGLIVGGILTLVGFVAYATNNPTLNLAGFFYGIPLLLGGLALSAAELPPVPCQQTSPDIVALREQQATPTQNQVRLDVTRYRYGQDAHLDTSLKSLGLTRTSEDTPALKALQETKIDDAYALILQFHSPLVPLEVWEQKREKMENFFGPGVRVTVNQPSEDEVDVTVIATPKVLS